MAPWALRSFPKGTIGPPTPIRNEFSQCQIEYSQIKGRELSKHLRFHKSGDSFWGGRAQGSMGQSLQGRYALAIREYIYICVISIRNKWMEREREDNLT